MGYLIFPHSCVAFRCTLYSALLSFSFFMCKNLISSFILSFTVLYVMNLAAQEVYFYFGVMWSLILLETLTIEVDIVTFQDLRF